MGLLIEVTVNPNDKIRQDVHKVDISIKWTVVRVKTPLYISIRKMPGADIIEMVTCLQVDPVLFIFFVRT